MPLGDSRAGSSSAKGAGPPERCPAPCDCAPALASATSVTPSRRAWLLARQSSHALRRKGHSQTELRNAMRTDFGGAALGAVGVDACTGVD